MTTQSFASVFHHLTKN